MAPLAKGSGKDNQDENATREARETEPGIDVGALKF